MSKDTRKWRCVLIAATPSWVRAPTPHEHLHHMSTYTIMSTYTKPLPLSLPYSPPPLTHLFYKLCRSFGFSSFGGHESTLWGLWEHPLGAMRAPFGGRGSTLWGPWEHPLGAMGAPFGGRGSNFGGHGSTLWLGDAKFVDSVLLLHNLVTCYHMMIT